MAPYARPANARPAGYPIIPRRVRLEFGKLTDAPKDWFNVREQESLRAATVAMSDQTTNDTVTTELFHALSILFPAGETFFVKSVLKYGPKIQAEHPELWEQVQLFFKQEGTHTAVHETWNERIEAEYGHPMGEIDDMLYKRLGSLAQRLPPMTSLAVTACLEHFTDGLAALLLGSPEGLLVMSQMQEPQRSLWAWHAVEELEHKTVAFDVFKAMGGGYGHRVMVMLAVAPLFLARVTWFWWKFAKARGLPFWPSVGQLLKFLLWSPGMLRKFVPHFLLWFKPGYHPRDHDATDKPLVEKWGAMLRAKTVQDDEAREVVLLVPDYPVPATPPDLLAANAVPMIAAHL